TINANAAGFEKGNVQGTLAMLAAATAGGVRRFVHVSSLAAREPKLSLYGGSKARAEELVHSSGLDWAIVRPPAVYGPGDKDPLLARHPAARRGASRPMVARREGQADHRPRRLFLPPQLGDRAQARLPASAVATPDRDAPGPRRHRRLVPSERLAVELCRARY